MQKEVGCVLIMQGWDIRMADRTWDELDRGRAGEMAAANAARKEPLSGLSMRQGKVPEGWRVGRRAIKAPSTLAGPD